MDHYYYFFFKFSLMTQVAIDADGWRSEKCSYIFPSSEEVFCYKFQTFSLTLDADSYNLNKTKL